MKPKSTDGLVVLCYELQATSSSSQSIIAIPRYPTAGDTDWSDCTLIDEQHPLVMQQYLVFKVKVPADLRDPKQPKLLLNVNVTSQPGTPNNPTPVRAGISQPSGVSAYALLGEAKAPVALNGVYYARWPYPLAPDADVSISLNVVYPSPVSGGPWTANTLYPAGSVVSLSSPSAQGHYFVALNSGMSASAEPSPPGVALPDGSVRWTDLGTTAPNLPKAPALWEANHHYKAGEVVQSAWNGHFLLASQSGTSSASPPVIPPGTMKDGSLTWQDAGIASPGVSAQAEQNVAIVSQTLPHVHALSRYNLTAGVVYSTVKNRSFGFNTANTPIETSSSPIVDPVLFVTFYIWPIDAERSWQVSDLRPGVALGLSLSSPSSDFYLGGISEIARNVQLVYGVTAAKVSHLAPANTFNPMPGAMAVSPATVQEFDLGAYVGLSFNFIGFIGSLFGGSH